MACGLLPLSQSCCFTRGPGGYVGVDVFFVISGFLITSLILRDLDASKFSMIDFWERRVRRIAPALTVWVAATLAAGWFLYLPDDFDRLGQAVVTQGLVLSNVYHEWKIDYFNSGTGAFPRLHTWSLAIGFREPGSDAYHAA